MNDLHVSSGAYALDALDDQERARCDVHLAECPECRAEVASFLETTSHLASTTELAAPTELRARVLSGISQVRPLPPLGVGRHLAGSDDSAAPTPVESPPQPVTTPASPQLESTHPTAAASAEATPDNVVPLRRRPVARLVAAAAVIVALVGGGGLVAVHPWSDNGGNQQAGSAIDRVLNAPDRVQRTKHLAIGGEATIVRSVSEGRAVMSIKDLPTPPSGKAYELWLQQPSGALVPAGLMGADQQQALLKGDAAKATAAGITVEPAAGSASPTSAPVAWFAFGSAT